MSSALPALLFLSSAVFSAWLGLIVYARLLRSANHHRRLSVLNGLGLVHPERKKLVGYFHPYCNAGGGGERVLWAAIAAQQRSEPNLISVVYSGDVDASKEQIIAKVKTGFDINLDPSTLHFVFLHSRYMVEDSTWPHFTLLGQSLGSMYLAWEAMSKLIPDLYIDTMGYAFTFRVVSFLGKIPVGAYVHFPTISTEMLARVESRKKWHTNPDSITSSVILSKGKLIYYRLFMYHYALCLRTAAYIMVNSSWTRNHIDSILRHSDPLLDSLHMISPLSLLKEIKSKPMSKTPLVVHPSCNTRAMAELSLEGRERVILSVAQFRPEKDHEAQLRAFHKLLSAHPEHSIQDVKLVLLGGSRNAGDAARVETLRGIAKELGIEGRVEFIVNAPYTVMLGWLSRAYIGLSTMVDEHFGINIVEYMAAGLIPVTHASGGPFNDIVVPFNGEPTGFHATTPDTFAEALHTVFTLSTKDELAMRQRARTWALQGFSEEVFTKSWNASGWRACIPQ